MAAGLLVGALSVVPTNLASATGRATVWTAPTPGPADLPRLTAELGAVTARAQALTAQLEEAAARDGGLRVALERAESAHEAAQQQLDTRARAVYMADQPDPLGALTVDLAAPDLHALAQRGQQAALQVDRALIGAVTDQEATLRGLRSRADAFRARLLPQAEAVLAAQDRARQLLAEAQAAAAQLAAAQAAEAQRRLAAQQAALDAVSSTVTVTLTPAQTTRSRAAAADQAPVVALLESSGDQLPAGYVRSGQSFSGTASWYGPGFVGRPTASGAPYDPERLTCANKEVPLGTVLHVSANGLSVNCLVNDRGPYVGDRVLDMSRAGARALGYDGLAQVVVEVLVPR